jgi:hypothetical protein
MPEARRTRGSFAASAEDAAHPEVIIITGNGTIETAITADSARRL